MMVIFYCGESYSNSLKIEKDIENIMKITINDLHSQFSTLRS